MCVFSGLDPNVAIWINNYKYRQPRLTATWSLCLYFSQLAINPIKAGLADLQQSTVANPQRHLKGVLHSFSTSIYGKHVY